MPRLLLCVLTQTDSPLAFEHKRDGEVMYTEVRRPTSSRSWKHFDRPTGSNTSGSNEKLVDRRRHFGVNKRKKRFKLSLRFRTHLAEDVV